tara:strand:- start:10124 stop:10513 length:390 start_codon:yes stop_codon:yes gene_type:complete
MSEKLYWVTPPELYNELNSRFLFDFDPCPNPRPPGFDGLAVAWGERNYVNPPFTGGVMKWVRKAIKERDENNKLTALILPSYQSKAANVLHYAGAEVEFIGCPRWLDLKTLEPNPCPQRELHPCLLFVL